MNLAIFLDGGAIRQRQTLETLVLPSSLHPSSLFISDIQGNPVPYRLAGDRVQLIQPSRDSNYWVEYSFGQIGWRPRYRAGENNETLKLTSLVLYGDLEISAPMTPRTLRLIFRSLPTLGPTRVEMESQPQAMLVSAPRAMVHSAPPIHQPRLESQTETFQIDIPVIPLEAGTSVLPLITWRNLDLPQVYFVNLGRLDGGFYTDRPTQIRFGYRFQAPQDLPPGVLILFQEEQGDKNERSEYSLKTGSERSEYLSSTRNPQSIPIASGEMEEKRQGDEVTLIFGTTTLVNGEVSLEIREGIDREMEDGGSIQGTSPHEVSHSTEILPSGQGVPSVIEVKFPHPKILQVRFRATLVNHRDVEVQTFLHLGLNSGYLLESSLPYRFWRGRLEFPVSLPPKRKTVIEGRLKIAQPSD